MENTKTLDDNGGNVELHGNVETGDKNGSHFLSENQDIEGEKDANAGGNDNATTVAECGDPMQDAEYEKSKEVGEPMDQSELEEPIREVESGESNLEDKAVEPKQEEEVVERKRKDELEEPMEEAESAELHFDQDFLSHFEFKTVIQDTIGALIKSDPLLSDLHPHVTVQEVNALIELEHGRAMTVYVEREDGQYWSVVVPREATVHEFKTALKHAVTLKMNRLGMKKKTSWKYMWKTYFLCYEGQKLEDDNARLLDLGIRNKSSLTFKKKLNERQRIRLAARPSDERTTKS